MVDFELQHNTRHCAASGRELRPGETYYTVLPKKGAEVERADYSSEAWTGPPEICWLGGNRHCRTPAKAKNNTGHPTT